MQREDRQLDGKANQEQPEDSHYRHYRLHHAQPLVGYLQHAQAAGGEVQAQDTGQHEGAAEQGIQDVLYRRVVLPARSPYGDQEIHGDNLYLPHEEEQQEVKRHKHPQDACLQEQQPGEILSRPFVNLPGDEYRQETEKGSQHYHRQAQSVHAEVVMGVKRRNPQHLLLELDYPGCRQ
ncbi:hypothetical protein ES703_79161 [subsurface metagenome]